MSLAEVKRPEPLLRWKVAMRMAEQDETIRVVHDGGINKDEADILLNYFCAALRIIAETEGVDVYEVWDDFDKRVSA